MLKIFENFNQSKSTIILTNLKGDNICLTPNILKYQENESE